MSKDDEEEEYEEGDMVVVSCGHADDGVHNGIIVLFIDDTHFVLSDEVEGCPNSHSVDEVVLTV